MSGISEVTVTQLDSTSAASPAPACTVTHRVPAIVFALGGLTGNYFHDFSDALVPLFVASRRYGGEVQLLAIADPRFDVRVEELARSVNSFDVLLGVHGAGLTNAVFMPTGAVVIQVVPYGNLEHMAKVDFGDPVADMGLRYLEYSITAEESTLLEMLGPDHPVIKDPESVHRSGWDKVAEYYLGKQDVRVDVERFAPTLALAIEHLRQK
ncbi:unnamed protein product [Triticum turgidum subsp. durum]|uniref:Glycosyltransferase 61 catalytic domain-containing protein n=1 Tax=Triticum turgidum subsp. durum TaxID=4567 RepID=A0A9R1Q5A4_TRITD|nr:unnamed protein product [Triticum turgidum subsp. durum]